MIRFADGVGGACRKKRGVGASPVLHARAHLSTMRQLAHHRQVRTHAQKARGAAKTTTPRGGSGGGGGRSGDKDASWVGMLQKNTKPTNKRGGAAGGAARQSHARAHNERRTRKRANAAERRQRLNSPFKRPFLSSSTTATSSHRYSLHLLLPPPTQTLSSSKFQRVSLGDRPPTRLQYSLSPAGRRLAVALASMLRRLKQSLFAVSAGLQPPLAPS